MGENINMAVEVCGVKFKNPFVLAPGTSTMGVENMKRSIEAGWAGAVIKTLFPIPHSRVAPDQAISRALGLLDY